MDKMGIHHRLVPTVRCYSEKPFPGKVKALINLQGRKGGKARSPVLEPTKKERAHMKDCLKNAGLI